MAKTMPYSLEAEESLLGNLLIYKEALREVTDAGLLSEDFYFEKHQRIFAIISDMHSRGQDVDTVSLSVGLKDYDCFEKYGGMDYLLRLTSATVSNANTKEYIRIIKNKAYARKLILTANSIMNKGYDGSVDIYELLSTAEQAFSEINRSRNISDFIDSQTVFTQALKKIHKIHDQGSVITGVKSMYNDLDRLTTGFQNGDLIILAARPSVGKTALALNIALHAAATSGGAIAIFSLEMPAEQLAIRMLSAKSMIAGQKLRTGQLSNDDWSKLDDAVGTLRKQLLFIDDTPGIKLHDMFAKCRTLANKYGLSLVIVDYIQLVQGQGRFESRQQEVSEISRQLKALARDLKVPVIALSQLSRSVERREDKRPMLSDLRESGSIEQDADLVLFLYREEYYNRKEESEKPATEEVELSLAKHRNGPTGMIKLIFERDINAFYGVKQA